MPRARSIRKREHVCPKELKSTPTVDEALAQAAPTGTPAAEHTRSGECHHPKRNYRSYSSQVKLLRRRAKQTRDGQQARMVWKQMWRLRAQEKEQRQRDLLSAVLREDWQALRAVKGAKRTQVWEEELTTAEGWQTDMRTHFAGIFAKMPAEQVKQGVEVIWDQLQRACKRVRWRPFSKEELILSTQTWAKGKSTGPDGISYEALRLLLQHHCWEATLLEEFNDALYKGRSPPNTKKSITVLLPRARQPSDWGQTRPITLSSSMLKWQAQLLLGRVGEAIMRDAKYQFARPGRQAPELMLLLRRTIRICREWDIPIHVAKVDVSSIPAVPCADK